MLVMLLKFFGGLWILVMFLRALAWVLGKADWSSILPSERRRRRDLANSFEIHHAKRLSQTRPRLLRFEFSPLSGAPNYQAQKKNQVQVRVQSRE
jgi:hypothetical protein